MGYVRGLPSLAGLGSEVLVNSSELGFGASVNSSVMFPAVSEISTSGSGSI
jgi:hypothetical protein